MATWTIPHHDLSTFDKVLTVNFQQVGELDDVRPEVIETVMHNTRAGLRESEQWKRHAANVKSLAAASAKLEAAKTRREELEREASELEAQQTEDWAEKTIALRDQAAADFAKAQREHDLIAEAASRTKPQALSAASSLARKALAEAKLAYLADRNEQSDAITAAVSELLDRAFASQRRASVASELTPDGIANQILRN